MKVGIGCSPCHLSNVSGASSKSWLSGLTFGWDGASLVERVTGLSGATVGSPSFANDGLYGKCCTCVGNADAVTFSQGSFPGGSVSTSNPIVTVGMISRLADNTGNPQMSTKGGNASREWRWQYISGSGMSFSFGKGDTTTCTAVGDYTNAGSTGQIANDTWAIHFVWWDANAGANGTTYIQGALASQPTLNSWSGNPYTNAVANSSGARGAPNSGNLAFGQAFGTLNPKGSRCNGLWVWNRQLTLTERQSIWTLALAGTNPMA